MWRGTERERETYQNRTNSSFSQPVVPKDILECSSLVASLSLGRKKNFPLKLVPHSEALLHPVSLSNNLFYTLSYQNISFIDPQAGKGILVHSLDLWVAFTPVTPISGGTNVTLTVGPNVCARRPFISSLLSVASSIFYVSKFKLLNPSRRSQAPLETHPTLQNTAIPIQPTLILQLHLSLQAMVNHPSKATLGRLDSPLLSLLL